MGVDRLTDRLRAMAAERANSALAAPQTLDEASERIVAIEARLAALEAFRNKPVVALVSALMAAAAVVVAKYAGV